MWGDSAAAKEAATRLSSRVTVGTGGAALRMDHELKVPTMTCVSYVNPSSRRSLCVRYVR